MDVDLKIIEDLDKIFKTKIVFIIFAKIKEKIKQDLQWDKFCTF